METLLLMLKTTPVTIVIRQSQIVNLVLIQANVIIIIFFFLNINNYKLF